MAENCFLTSNIAVVLSVSNTVYFFANATAKYSTVNAIAVVTVDVIVDVTVGACIALTCLIDTTGRAKSGNDGGRAIFEAEESSIFHFPLLLERACGGPVSRCRGRWYGKGRQGRKLIHANEGR